MKPVPNVEITGTVTRFGLESNPDGSAVLVLYTEDENGAVGRTWAEFAPASAQALKSAARNKLHDHPDDSARAEQVEDLLRTLPGFNFTGGAPTFGGSVVRGTSYGVSGGTVTGDVHGGTSGDE